MSTRSPIGYLGDAFSYLRAELRDARKVRLYKRGFTHPYTVSNFTQATFVADVEALRAQFPRYTFTVDGDEFIVALR